DAYIYGPENAPIEQVNLTDGTITYLVSDRLGSVRGTVNAAGSLTQSTSYDAWGNPQTSDGLSGLTPFGYAGDYTDPTGLNYNIRRYYDPQTGQFVSVDPLVDQTELPYSYALDDPIDASDLSGTCATKVEPGPSVCPGIWRDIVRRTIGGNGAFTRYWEMLDDSKGIFPDPNHVASFNQMKRSLTKSLNAFKRYGCDPPDEQSGVTGHQFYRFAKWIATQDRPTQEEHDRYQSHKRAAGGGEAKVDITTLPPTITFMNSTVIYVII
ncbi:MAG TPA: RHS repeat-associated core domain-containing protein, partial [Thermoleophilaceae bacterium]|nr:RHS repeat-associated core domain-containing protein [Thermoleophilaceae bacterium]